MQYKQYTLDQFQIDAIECIEKNHSVVVSAATGTGKTLIADYIINKALQENKRVVYTAPIKALSNQKYREFSKEYGAKVGILTGDVVINHTAPILIMTTEIYRNMLLEANEIDVSYVIFDEIHYINDLERGTVWEESIIFSPDSVRFLCLSATIPNYRQFADWISAIKHHQVDCVNYMKRAVPLTHKCFDPYLGFTTIDAIMSDARQHQHRHSIYRKKSQKSQRVRLAHHTQLIEILEEKNLVPTIFFSFSRALCHQRAIELAKKKDYLNADQKKIVIELFDKIPAEVKGMQTTQELKHVLVKGIGVHHAGLLSSIKETVELLFDKQLIKVLYATETFAVGINMPAKSVCFGSLEKYDGITFRVLNSKEYFQLAGRAGRRGIDKEGYSIAIIDRNHPELFAKIKQITTADTDPIISRYSLSYNTVLNLYKYHAHSDIEKILKNNFGYFCKRQSESQARISQSFANYSKILKKMEYLQDEKLTQKGEFASKIYTKELEVTELVFSGILHQVSIGQMCTILAALIYEPRRTDSFESANASINAMLKILDEHEFLARRLKKPLIKKMYNVINSWINMCEFDDLLTLCNLAEGDIVRIFRQLIDIIRQIKGSLLAIDKKHPLINKLNEALERIDRSIVQIDL